MEKASFARIVNCKLFFLLKNLQIVSDIGLVPGTALDWLKLNFGITYPFVIRLHPETEGDGGVNISPEHIIPSGEEVLAGLVQACHEGRPPSGA